MAPGRRTRPEERGLPGARLTQRDEVSPTLWCEPLGHVAFALGISEPQGGRSDGDHHSARGHDGPASPPPA